MSAKDHQAILSNFTSSFVEGRLERLYSATALFEVFFEAQIVS
jgi:hypothetical protein